MQELNPDKRAKNRKKQVLHHRKVTGLPGKELQARQDTVIELLTQGFSIENAVAQVGVKRGAYEMWKQRWPNHFAARADRAIAKARGDFEVDDRPFDASFRQEFFGYSTPPHLQRLMDVINRVEVEARESKRRRRVMILMPPEHAKSTLLEDYVTYRIAQDPAIRCLFVCANLNQAKKRTGLIQRRMVERTEYDGFIENYGPFKSELRADMKPWTANYFTVFHAPVQRDRTLEALGVKGSIYGNRAEVIVLDDIAELDNQTPQQIEDQWSWIFQEVRTRLVKGGMLIVIGTHIRENDIYSVLEDKGFIDEVIKIPAITREPGTLSEEDLGECLWPDEHPLDELLEIRQEDQRAFELVYQQNPLPSIGAIFTQESYEACLDKSRHIGHIPEKTQVVAGVDPSVSHFTAGVVIAVKPGGMRYLVDAWNEKGLTGEGGDLQAGVVEFIVELCRRYGVRTLAVENFSWSALINTSLTLRKQLHELGVQHYPVSDYGPGSGEREQHSLSQLSGLFNYGLISIPNALQSEGHLRAFKDQLITYRPDAGKRVKNDLVKAFRMAEWAVKYTLTGQESKNVTPIAHVPAYMRAGKGRPAYMDAV